MLEEKKASEEKREPVILNEVHTLEEFQSILPRLSQNDPELKYLAVYFDLNIGQAETIISNLRNNSNLNYWGIIGGNNLTSEANIYIMNNCDKFGVYTSVDGMREIVKQLQEPSTSIANPRTDPFRESKPGSESHR